MAEEQQAVDVQTETDRAQKISQKKVANWFRTIIWMVSMMVAFNIVAVLFAYFFLAPK